MKTFYTLCILLLLTATGYSQKEANRWYFGNMAGLDFNSGSPVPFSGSAMVTLEGCASIADTMGNTLFYTNGLSVWNKNNAVMPNGTGLLGDNNSAQSSIIVCDPGNHKRYYIFTTPANGNRPMYYNLVDMTLQSGLGDVTTKNIALFNNATEKVTAVYHANHHDIWVIGHQFNNDSFYAYLVSDTGVNASPVISRVGSIHQSLYGFSGYMKGSHRGHKLGYACTSNMNLVELLDFDNSSGVVSNPITLTGITEAYGLEFSPDDSKLYVSQENPRKLVQWDLSSGNTALIKASQTTIYAGASGASFAALQLAPDGKIYMAKLSGSKALAAITQPNLAGAACAYADTGVILTYGNSTYGLPNFFQSFFDTGLNSIIPAALFRASDTLICTATCIHFQNLSTNSTAWQWSFPGSNRLADTAFNPAGICYSTAGLYPVQLIASKGNIHDTLNLQYYIKVNPQPDASRYLSLPDSACPGTAISLHNPDTGVTVYWQTSVNGTVYANLAGTDSSYTGTATQTAYYRAIAVNGTCIDTSAPHLLTIYPTPAPPLITASDSIFCVGDSAQLCVSGAYAVYQWNTGQTGNCIYTKNAGGYWVSATDGYGCETTSAHKSLYVYPVPSVSITVLGDTLTSMNAVAYQWYLNGQVLPGATQPLHIARTPGAYAVQITDTNGCKALSSEVEINTLGIGNLPAGPIRIYPNPAGKYVTIEYEMADGDMIELKDILGRNLPLQTTATNHTQITIGLADLATGPYLIWITRRNGKQVAGKFLKQ